MSLADGLGMGIGFTLALMVVAAIREVIGNGTLTVWGSLRWTVPGGYEPTLLMVLAPGGFVALGCILAAMNSVQARLVARGAVRYTPPQGLDCRHCIGCRLQP
jgi:electron transport complex protein RnfE